MQTDVRHLDDVLQLPGLLLDLGGQEQRGRGHGVAVEAGERVEHVETLHVHDGRVDAQLGAVKGGGKAKNQYFYSQKPKLNL